MLIIESVFYSSIILEIIESTATIIIVIVISEERCLSTIWISVIIVIIPSFLVSIVALIFCVFLLLCIVIKTDIFLSSHSLWFFLFLFIFDEFLLLKLFYLEFSKSK